MTLLCRDTQQEVLETAVNTKMKDIRTCAENVFIIIYVQHVDFAIDLCLFCKVRQRFGLMAPLHLGQNAKNEAWVRLKGDIPLRHENHHENHGPCMGLSWACHGLSKLSVFPFTVSWSPLHCFALATQRSINGTGEKDIGLFDSLGKSRLKV